jgi:NADH-quinone oxidoreductase subunit L
MLLPLVPLALGAIFVGALGYSVWGMFDPSLAFWNGSLTILHHHEHVIPTLAYYAPLIAATSGIALSYVFYIRHPQLPILFKMQAQGLYQFLLNKWYFDELYDRLFVRNAVVGGNWLWRAVDTHIIDRLGPNGFAFVSRAVALRSARLQTGFLYHYAFAMLIGLLVLISWLAYAVAR